MGLISKTAMTKWMHNNKIRYEERGYVFTKYKDELEVNIKDLSNSSHVLVNVKCDCGNCKNPYLKPMTWVNYLTNVHKDNKYYCNECAKKLYGGVNIQKSKLKNSISFKQWCIENNRQDILDRWDYELNNCKPSEISFGTQKRYYFKCLRNLHNSELKNIKSFTSGQNGSMDCNACNSIAQWGIDNLGEDFLDKYWDYEKNIVSPWDIDKCSNKHKIFIKCQEKYYHESYEVSPDNFTNSSRCPYCNNRNGKIHKLDSLGTIYPDVFKFWSDKNENSPYEYAPMSHQYVWWKCPDEKHEDYYRLISSSSIRDFRCPECQCSTGEIEVGKKLLNKEIYYIPQKTFDGLIGLGGGLLSYDFYIPKINLLIEYQGEMHERFVRGIHKSIKDFEKQVEHDRRKKEYAEQNKYNFLEIWYQDFDNIEEILTKELNLLEEVMLMI